MERAQREELAGEVLESEYARADLDNASLRFSSMRRFGGSGPRRRGRATLREEGYDGD
jgi:hypothetical protein